MLELGELDVFLLTTKRKFDNFLMNKIFSTKNKQKLLFQICSVVMGTKLYKNRQKRLFQPLKSLKDMILDSKWRNKNSETVTKSKFSL